jgi:hypothetical protein
MCVHPIFFTYQFLMIMKNHVPAFALFFIVFAMLTFAACEKDGTDLQPTDTDLLKKFFDKYAPKSETFTFNATKFFSLKTTKGTTINFPANVLVDDKGKAITGDVKVTVKEVQNAAEMLFSDKPTLTQDDKMLVSFGEIKIDVTQSGKNLLLRDTTVLYTAMAYARSIATANINEIPVWTGDTTETRIMPGLNSEGIEVNGVIPAEKGIDWSQTNKAAYIDLSTKQISLAINKLRVWYNCDSLLQDKRPKTTILGYFNSNFNKTTFVSFTQIAPSGLFFKPKNLNTLVKLYNVIVNPTAGKEGFYSRINGFPIGLEGTFLAISMLNGKFYADMKEVTIAAPVAGKTFTGITFSPVEVTEVELLAKINSLNSK